ncbi:hypothetical protein AB0D74_48375 [Streptomyces sp. NPDC048278]|uniref:hypothetical protein n=1 Tax=Streptomyces sp. NPDC048278 TaxID=3155809 RepID=UPI003416AD54
MISNAARTVVLKPGDTLLISNCGQTSEEALDALREGASRLRHALGLGEVVLFEHDIEVAALAPVTAAPDAVVLRVFDSEAVEQHRATLGTWLEANGIDPSTVVADWLSIEQAGDQRLIRYSVYRIDQDGRRLVDPRDQNQSWAVERVSPLVVDLHLSAGQMLTKRDESP